MLSAALWSLSREKPQYPQLKVRTDKANFFGAFSPQQEQICEVFLGLTWCMTRRVLKFTQMVKPFKQGVFLCFRRIHRIFKSQFHGISRLSSLTPEQWVGRHATLRGRCSCLPTRYYYYTIFDTLCQGKNLGAVFPPRLKRRGFHAEEIDEFVNSVAIK